MKTSADWFVPFALPSLNGLWPSVTQHRMQTACMAAAELMAALCLFGEELADAATTEPKWSLCGWKPGWGFRVFPCPLSPFRDSCGEALARGAALPFTDWLSAGPDRLPSTAACWSRTGTPPGREGSRLGTADRRWTR